MARRFAKVLEEEIEDAFFYPSDLVNNFILILYLVSCFTSQYFHHYSPPLQGIVVYYNIIAIIMSSSLLS